MEGQPHWRPWWTTVATGRFERSLDLIADETIGEFAHMRERGHTITAEEDACGRQGWGFGSRGVDPIGVFRASDQLVRHYQIKIS